MLFLYNVNLYIVHKVHISPVVGGGWKQCVGTSASASIWLGRSISSPRTTYNSRL